jgi:hypothetical protein
MLAFWVGLKSKIPQANNTQYNLLSCHKNVFSVTKRTKYRENFIPKNIKFPGKILGPWCLQYLI